MDALCAVFGAGLAIVGIVAGIAWWAGAGMVLTKAAVQEARAGTLTAGQGMVIGFIIAGLLIGLLRVLQQ